MLRRMSLPVVIQVAEDSWRTGVGDNQKRPNSGIASDHFFLQHTGAKGYVFTCVALATPDHVRKLFILMCFQCPMAVASNAWLPPVSSALVPLCVRRRFGFVARECPKCPLHVKALSELSARAVVHHCAVRARDL
ncbi:unnamed protein product [Effrenium voratum]|uniref:Uncharacterized protein n=1 Tax=Effrenium voratum TaxID=2562239 RepID=A0AA36NK86_9DINO|nr:unnamed protein product [Effrenium voratum]CAJ1445383.1 unnamed protein product [Effrenium voratum]